MKVYGITNCNTVKKALDWLKENKVDYNFQDFFYKADGTQVLGPVDQSIQLGDGGTGITLEANAFTSPLDIAQSALLSPETGSAYPAKPS